MSPFVSQSRLSVCACLLACLVLLQTGAGAQDRLRSLPGYAHYQQMAPRLAGAARTGSVAVRWSADSRSFEYTRAGVRYQYDVADRRATRLGSGADPAGRGAPGPAARGAAQGLPERGRQYASADSPDGRLRAEYRHADRNLYVLDLGARSEYAVTTDGSHERRVKNGTASWVYGEELEQRSAMWWSPDGGRLAFYRFDESRVTDYFLQLDQTKLQSSIDVEAYPKAGTPNPIVDILVHDLASRETTLVDVRDGRPFDDEVTGHYVYGVSWSPDGRELLFLRTNRRQNVLELAAADPVTGAVRVVLREEWPSGWIETNPVMVFLKDGRRFIWESERNGWKNFYLYDLDGELIAPLTAHTTFEAATLVKIDEEAGVLFYTARGGDNHLKLQLYRVGLDGRDTRRLTDPAFHHTIGSCLSTPGPGVSGGGASCGISPDNRYVVDVYQTHDTPAATRLVDAASGAILAEIAAADTSRFDELGLRRAEMFTYTSADGRSTLHGLIQFPSNFDPARTWPVLIPVYGGPGSASHTARETFVTPTAAAELGFLLVTLDSRAAPGRGRSTMDGIYRRLGQAEVDDIAEGVRALARRPYVDASRIGIYGTSYGGYTALMSLLRHPDLYAAASASSPVTSWVHYDTIYTERYMGLPQDNPAGYEAGSAMTHVRNLRGRLMLYYATADNNVHPSNAMQLIAALQSAGKSFDVQVGPDRGHSGINTDRMMEFFIEHLVLRPAVNGY
jgi:dipeptidyl-peptidase 4